MLILVTGGAGFIGSHLCEVLLDQGHRVYCMDNYTTGSMDNLSGILHHPKLTLMYHDVTVEKELAFRADQIYHLACPASPKDYQSDPIKTLMTSFLGTRNMLEYAKKVGARILFTSTSEVYGDPLVSPQQEEYWGNVNPIGIRSCYDEGKRVAETLMMDYHRHAGVDTRIVRIFNTFGPRMLFNDGRVVSNFIVQALKGEDITVYGEGQQTRSFCYVDDLVKGIMATMNKEGFYGPVNLGNPNEMTIIDLAKRVIELTGSKSTIVKRPLPQDDPTRRQPDISVAKRELNWAPHVDLDTGLKKTIANFEERLRAGEGV
jgi:UDP-glucuronate decarboxylase